MEQEYNAYRLARRRDQVDKDLIEFAALYRPGRVQVLCGLLCCSTCSTAELDARGAYAGVFYHQQDAELAFDEQGKLLGWLWLGYGVRNGTDIETATFGGQLRSYLQRRGYAVEWDGNPLSRMAVFVAP